ncbi:MAG: hypothetical protein A2Y67_03645 [Candidatus Buchananbacteria bacterium RBG_13_39_9]|uniref:Uncharacterized protein n=1 Tax=Candidatus Buchananbacteria bacterium RBG_13_39_9 TaxID=1797531 RepID=A0A1G1XRU3_9BACT|nr:MAG: hypothetical protein A2Y67_03645 [Candidatus Buchananbacteria bacterium RBG_13_39_9]
MEEFRCILTNQEALELMNRAKTIFSYHAIDEYTGIKRIRQKNFTEIIEQDYPTEVTGKIARIGMKIELAGIKIPTYLELKITDQQFSRWEIEFEGEAPEQYKNRESIRGWQILIDQNK